MRDKGREVGIMKERKRERENPDRGIIPQCHSVTEIIW